MAHNTLLKCVKTKDSQDLEDLANDVIFISKIYSYVIEKYHLTTHVTQGIKEAVCSEVGLFSPGFQPVWILCILCLKLGYLYLVWILLLLYFCSLMYRYVFYFTG